jgi:transposase InsO family protein
VRRLLREHGLLSPYRHRPAEPSAHEGTITTHAPHVLWGTDGARAFTLDDGWGWIFSAIEHWNGECVGIHVAKKGDRFAALEPVAQGLTRLYGAVTAEVARGLSLRMDHGTQSLADDFQHQIQHWGITPSFAFVEQPQTNGVAERFNRTLKEQVLHGRTYRTLDELRAAVTDFVHTYNTQWRLEKLAVQGIGSGTQGEGSRKVWARLRLLRGLRVARKRVLRLMREHRLLFPQRRRTGSEKAHDGTITTAALNGLWVTDGARIFTVDDGWVWVFAAVEHWNAECVGVHVCQKGDRFAALQPIAMGLTRLYGGTGAETARGLSRRMDHGTRVPLRPLPAPDPVLGDHPRASPSWKNPRPHGVAERFNRTLKEQVIHGRTFPNVEEVRAAVTDFVHTYNHPWRLEQLGFLTPAEARTNHASTEAKPKAA